MGIWPKRKTKQTPHHKLGIQSNKHCFKHLRMLGMTRKLLGKGKMYKGDKWIPLLRSVRLSTMVSVFFPSSLIIFNTEETIPFDGNMVVYLEGVSPVSHPWRDLHSSMQKAIPFWSHSKQGEQNRAIWPCKCLWGSLQDWLLCSHSSYATSDIWNWQHMMHNEEKKHLVHCPYLKTWRYAILWNAKCWPAMEYNPSVQQSALFLLPLWKYKQLSMVD